MSREEEIGTYSHDHIPNLPLSHNAIHSSSKYEEQTLSNTMAKPLYRIFLRCFIIVENTSLSCKIADKKFDKKQRKHGKSLFAETPSTFSIM